MEEGRSAFKTVTIKATRKRPLRRSKRRWEDNVTMYLKETGINTRNWVGSAQGGIIGKLVNAALNLHGAS